MQIVNGYVCFTNCDATAARKGHDPRNPGDDPAKAAQRAGADKPGRTDRTEVVVPPAWQRADRPEPTGAVGAAGHLVDRLA